MNTVSVIIVNWNGKHFLAGCLEGLREQQYRSFETVVVDNGSQDGSVAFMEARYPEVKIITLAENRGFAAANNLAMRDAKTKYIALLNNDAIPDPRWLEMLVAAMDRHPEAGFLASKMVFEKDRQRIDRAGDSYTTAGAAWMRGRGASVDRFDQAAWVFGACAGAALYRTAMLQDIGLFDEDFFLLYEDVDLSFRAQLKGYKCLYVPKAIVYHAGSGTIVHDSPVSVYYGHRNLEWVYIKNMPCALIARSLLFHLIYDLVAFAYFVFRGRGGDIVRAKRDALKGFRRVLQKRKGIQTNKMVSDDYMRGLLDRPRLVSRLKNRIRQPREPG